MTRQRIRYFKAGEDKGKTFFCAKVHKNLDSPMKIEYSHMF